jgi:single-strand DNA-binding protein
MNLVVVQGNVGKDPIVKKFDGGSTCALFSVAVTERGYTKQDGTKVEDSTEWFNVISWGKQGELVGQYVKKGTPILVEGKLKTTKWTTESGETKYGIEIVADTVNWFGKRDTTQTVIPPQAQQNKPQSNEIVNKTQSTKAVDISDGELPF